MSKQFRAFLAIAAIAAVAIYFWPKSKQSDSSPSATDLIYYAPTPSAEERAANARRQRESEKAGQNAGTSRAIPWFGVGQGVPSNDEFDDLVKEALKEAKQTIPDLDENSFRSGYRDGFKKVADVVREGKRPAF